MKLKKIGISIALTSVLVGLASCGTVKSTKEETVTPNPEVVNPGTDGDQTSGDSTSGGSTSGGSSSGGSTSGGSSSGATGNGASEGALDSGNGRVDSVGAIEVTSCSGNTETAYVEFKKYNNAVSYNLYAKNKNGIAYELLDYKDVYIQELSFGKMRADIFGLAGGDYTIKVCPVTETTEIDNPTVVDVSVVAYDRSGYAHFNYTNGVGAYNDDGTLKDNAIVIYVTDDTKNTVELTYDGLTVKGIGNILNSTGQKCGEVGHEDQCKKVSSGKTYYGLGNENGGILKKLADANIPLAIRMVGLISESGNYEQKTYNAADAGLIDGLTDYNSVDYGGSEGDNGHMARMKSAKDVTIEGVGTNAGLDGWGIHFICETANPTLGKSFEARNLVFMNTPEDALGMEGVQDGDTITASVERCWVHHNTFLAPSISNPAESDKAEGDGSCDFKRGEYFTMSYNYFEYCHKTNLVGSSDTSLQYNLSYHHNLWYNCGSRIPLLRQANIHFYNNYIYGDSSDALSDLSYVTSLRANSYMYAENNYYEGCKNVFTDGDSGTAAKLYGNIMIQCFGDQIGTVVSDREASVSTACAYNGVSYQNFDTNSSLFYYNATTKQSDCYLTTAEVAREEVIKYAGSEYRTALNKTTLKTTDYAFNEKTPTSSVTAGSVTLPTAKGEQTVSNIVWTGITGVSSGTVKGRGKIATFKLDKYYTLNILMTGSSTQALNAGAVVNSQGKVMITGSGSVVLAPGIYTIVSCQKDKDSSITSISFEEYDSEALKQELINEYNAAYNKIPSNVEFTDSCYEIIKDAIDAYEALGSYKSEVTTTPYTAFNSYIALNVQYVEGLINEIGTVSKDSSQKIVAARNAYNKLMTKDNSATVSNYATLQAAETAYESFAVEGAIDLINAIGSTITLDSENSIALARSAYDSLDAEQKANVTNYNTLKAAEATLASLKNVDNVNKAIANIDVTSATTTNLLNVITAYNALTTAEQAQVTDTTKLEAIKVAYFNALVESLPSTIVMANRATIEEANAIYNTLTDASKTAVATNYATLTTATTALNELLNAAVTCTFNGAPSDSSVTVSGKYKEASATIDGVTYTKGLNMESSTTVTFTTVDVKTLTLHVTAGQQIKVDNETYTVPTNGVLVIDNLAAGTHTITKAKGSTKTYLYCLMIS